MTNGGNDSSFVANMPMLVILKEKSLKMYTVVRKKIKFDDISPTKYINRIKIII